MQCRLVAKHWLIIGFNRKINQSGLVDRLVYIQDIQDIYKIYKTYTKYQAAARRRRPGPAPRRRSRSGPGASGPGRAAAAWPPPGILYMSCMSCTYLVYLVYLVYKPVYQPVLTG